MHRSAIQTVMISAAAMLLLVGTAWAQQSGQSAGTPSDKQSQGQMQSGQQKQVTGKVLKSKEVTVKSNGQAKGKNLAVLIETQTGQKVVADLGNTKNLQDVNIKEDEQISVQGKLVRIGDRPVLLAERVQINDQVKQIDHPQRPQQQARQRASAQTPRELQGEIKKIKEVKFRDTQQTNQVVLLETEQGRQIAVDLGDTKQLQQVSLKEGMKIEVKGRPVRIGEQLVLLASHLTANGQTVSITHPKQKKS